MLSDSSTLVKRTSWTSAEIAIIPFDAILDMTNVFVLARLSQRVISLAPALKTSVFCSRHRNCSCTKFHLVSRFLIHFLDTNLLLSARLETVEVLTPGINFRCISKSPSSKQLRGFRGIPVVLIF